MTILPTDSRSYEMRFRFLGLLIMFITPVMSNDCHEAVVKQARDNHMFEFVMLNCIYAQSSGTTNVQGEAVIDPEVCLSTFNTESNNPGPNKIDLRDTLCTNRFASLIDVMHYSSTRVNFFGASVLGTDADHKGDLCDYDPVTKTIKMSYNCWFRLSVTYYDDQSFWLAYTDYLGIFQSQTGFSLVDTCSANEVRKMSSTRWFFSNLKSMLSNPANTSFGPCNQVQKDCEITTNTAQILHPYFKADEWTNYKADLSVKQAMCAGCYQRLMNNLQRDYASDFHYGFTDDVRENCKADPTSHLCLGTPFMGELLADFKTCSGYDIRFQSPLCSADQIATVLTSVDPSPYELFVKCAVNGAGNSAVCTDSIVHQFLDQLLTITGNDCSTCFQDFYADVQALAADDVVKAACSTTTLYSDACKIAIASPIASFMECSGSDITFTISKSLTAVGPMNRALDAKSALALSVNTVLMGLLILAIYMF